MKTTLKVGLDSIKTIILESLDAMLQSEIYMSKFDSIVAAKQYVINIDKSNPTFEFEIENYDDIKKEFEIWQNAYSMQNLIRYNSVAGNAKLWKRLVD